MAKAKAAQDYMAARQALVSRLDELQAELNDIRSALGVAGGGRAAGRPAAAKPGPKPGPKPGRGRGGRKRMRRGEGLLKILQTLNDRGPIMPRDIAEVTGITSGTVSNTLNTLKQSKQASRTDKGWTLTPSGKQELKTRS